MTTNYNYDNIKNFNTGSTAPVAVATAIRSSALDCKPLPFSSDNNPLTEQQIQNLQQQGFTPSLANSLNDVKKAFALRIWVVDNSGSMLVPDGHRIVQQTSNKSVKMVDCTRWDEIRSCVEYHMRLASLIRAPTRFRLLNRPSSMDGGVVEEFSIAEGQHADAESEVEGAIERLARVRPEGVTPLTKHIREIRQQVEDMAPTLRQTGERVAIIIATDGLPTDERGISSDFHRRQFVDALQNLQGLPIWIVIRLCTDEDDVVAFYNDLDSILEGIPLDVLDDFTAEAQEIVEFNPWVNYVLPLHRMREMGHHERLFDLIDERPFTKSEVRDYLVLLFGQGSFDGVPDAASDWKAFVSHVARLVHNESDQWNPLKRRLKPLVSVNKLRGRKKFLCV